MDSTSGSRTARAVAVGRAVGVGGHRDRLVTALLPRADRLAVQAARRLGAGRRRTVTLGVAGHAGLRMHAVDTALVGALRRTEASSVVILGAGYDTRAFRLQALRGRRVIEVDHPATQTEKLRRLPPADSALADLVLAGADLATDDLDRVLADVGHDPGEPTVWLWEAVVPYLPAVAVDATLDVLRARSAPGSRLLVTTVTEAWFDPPVLGRRLRRPASAVLRRIGEPVRLAESDADVAARLSRRGFLVRGVTGPRRWATDAGVRVVGPLLDERLHVADRAGR